MACFIVPAAEAIVVTAVTKMVRSKERKKKTVRRENDGRDRKKEQDKMAFSGELSWLRNMLWGGSALLAFEHIWHGEVVPWFPFLTAVSSAADTAGMFREMATVGVAMAAAVTLVWCGMMAASAAAEKKEKTGHDNVGAGAVKKGQAGAAEI